MTIDHPPVFRALRVSLVRGTPTLTDCRTGKVKPVRGKTTKDIKDQYCFLNMLCEIERETGQPAFSEFLFHPTRKWRLDAAFPNAWLAIEVQGLCGPTGYSGHLTIGGYVKDSAKKTAAEDLGWHVREFLWKQIRNGEAKASIINAIQGVHT